MDKHKLHKYFVGETTKEENEKIIEWAEASSENFQEFVTERNLYNVILLNSPQRFKEKKDIRRK